MIIYFHGNGLNWNKLEEDYLRSAGSLVPSHIVVLFMVTPMREKFLGASIGPGSNSHYFALSIESDTNEILLV